MRLNRYAIVNFIFLEQRVGYVGHTFLSAHVRDILVKGKEDVNQRASFCGTSTPARSSG